MVWTVKRFEDLSVEEFHDILRLRIDVFVVEQNCPYSELDGKDIMAFHFFGRIKEGGNIVAYTRIFRPGDYYEQAAIGRVVVHSAYRHKGIGYALMENSIRQVKELFDTERIKIGAQTYLKNFYESLGFQKVGESYLEDGIPHIHMVKS